MPGLTSAHCQMFYIIVPSVVSLWYSLHVATSRSRYRPFYYDIYLDKVSSHQGACQSPLVRLDIYVNEIFLMIFVLDRKWICSFTEDV